MTPAVLRHHGSSLLRLQGSAFTPVGEEESRACRDGGACEKRRYAPSREGQALWKSEKGPEMEMMEHAGGLGRGEELRQECRMLLADGQRETVEKTKKWDGEHELPAQPTLALQEMADEETESWRAAVEELEEERKKRRELEDAAERHAEARREVEGKMVALKKDLEKERAKSKMLEEEEEGRKQARVEDEERRKLAEEEQEERRAAAAAEEERRKSEQEERRAAAAAAMEDDEAQKRAKELEEREKEADAARLQAEKEAANVAAALVSKAKL